MGFSSESRQLKIFRRSNSMQFEKSKEYETTIGFHELRTFIILLQYVILPVAFQIRNAEL